MTNKNLFPLLTYGWNLQLNDFTLDDPYFDYKQKGNQKREFTRHRHNKTAKNRAKNKAARKARKLNR